MSEFYQADSEDEDESLTVPRPPENHEVGSHDLAKTIDSYDMHIG